MVLFGKPRRVIKIVNVIVPMYKARDTLPDLLDSFVAQTKKRFFITLVNDADGEDYSDIIEKYSDRGLHINYLINPKNEGPGGARQYGLDHNKMCDYVAFCDADDMVTPQYVELLYDHAKAVGADVVMSPIYVEKKHGISSMITVDKGVTWLHGKAYRYDYLKNRDIRFYEGIRCNEDGGFNNLALNMTDKLLKLEFPLYLWRDYKGSLTRVDRLDFTKVGSWQHIYCCLNSCIRLIEQGYIKEDKLIDFVQSYISLAYNFYQIILAVNGDHGNIEELIKEFLHKDYVQQILKDKNSIRKILKKIKISEIIDKKLYIFKDNFFDWIKEFGNVDLIQNYNFS